MSVADGELKLGKPLNGPNAVLAVFMASGGSKLTHKRTPICDDEHMPPRNNFKKIRIDWSTHGNLDGKFFGEFPRKGLRVILAIINATTGQLPLVARVLNEQNLPIE